MHARYHRTFQQQNQRTCQVHSLTACSLLAHARLDPYQRAPKWLRYFLRQLPMAVTQEQEGADRETDRMRACSRSGDERSQRLLVSSALVPEPPHATASMAAFIKYTILLRRAGRKRRRFRCPATTSRAFPSERKACLRFRPYSPTIRGLTYG